MFIDENGLGALDFIKDNGEIIDDYCIQYLKTHIQAMKDDVELDGVHLIGYTIWGCIDIVSAGTGEIKKDMDLSTLINMMMVQVIFHEKKNLFTDTKKLLKAMEKYCSHFIRISMKNILQSI